MRYIIQRNQRGFRELFDGNFKFKKESSPNENTLIFKWTPGYWKKSAQENKEVNQVLINKIKTGDFTMKELGQLAVFGAELMIVFTVSGIIAKRRVFGYKHQETPLYDEKSIQ